MRVVDMTHVVAGPWITRLLGEHGADVISIRNPTFPFLYPVVLEQSYGKKQIFLDVKTPAGMARLKELLIDADVFVWSYATQALDRLGLTEDALRRLNPNLILVRESGYGLAGPWADRKGWEQLAQTCCGAAVLASRGRQEKHIVAALPTDYGAGYLGAAGAISALRRREAEGGFWTVDITLCGTIILALSLPHEAEEAMPVIAAELGNYLVDQQWGDTVFTRLRSAAVLSHTPAQCSIAPSILGSCDARRTTWGTASTGGKPQREFPSAYARNGLLVGVLEGYGHEDIMTRKPDA